MGVIHKGVIHQALQYVVLIFAFRGLLLLNHIPHSDAIGVEPPLGVVDKKPQVRMLVRKLQTEGIVPSFGVVCGPRTIVVEPLIPDTDVPRSTPLKAEVVGEILQCVIPQSISGWWGVRQ